jgi:hypothetical protein
LFQNLNIVKVVRIWKPRLGDNDEDTVGSITHAHVNEQAVELRPTSTWDEFLPESRHLSDLPRLVSAGCGRDLHTCTAFHVSLTNSWVGWDTSSPAALDFHMRKLDIPRLE